MTARLVAPPRAAFSPILPNGRWFHPAPTSRLPATRKAASWPSKARRRNRLSLCSSGLATGKPLQSAGIALICGKSNDGALKVTQFLIEHGRAVVFIVDKDSAGQKVFSPKKLQAHGVEEEQIHFIGAPNELEELFTDEQWAETANAEWSRKDGRRWSTADIAMLRYGGKFSDDLKKLMWENADERPSNKQEMNVKLVLRLRTAEDVPEQLRKAFEAVVRLASGEAKN